MRAALFAVFAFVVVSPALAQPYPPPQYGYGYGQGYGHGDANPYLEGRQGDGRLGRRERERLWEIDQRLAELYHWRQRITAYPDHGDWRQVRRIDAETAQLAHEKRQLLRQQ